MLARLARFRVAKPLFHAMNQQNEGNPFPIILVSLAVLVVMSFLPWGKMTGGWLKDFNLLEDVSRTKTAKAAGSELIDPELEELLASAGGAEAAHDGGESGAVEPTSEGTDGGALDLDGTPVAGGSTPGVGNSSEAVSEPAPVKEAVSPRQGDIVVIEDYTPEGHGLSHFREALANRGAARIAMIGDSYIEGDIFSQNIRDGLQELYGGNGVGFMALHSDIPGFRQSVTQSDSGWALHDIRKSSQPYGRWLAGTYSTGEPGATATFKGAPRFPRAKQWGRSTFLFVAPSDGEIALKVNGEETVFLVTASEKVQAVSVPAPATSVTLRNVSVNGLVGLGLWLEGDGGVTLDCMSLRGNSGVALRKIDAPMVVSMREHIDYDLIIVEYGLNAVSSQQEDYSPYAKVMEGVIASIKRNYPEADILLMGIGDRGQKIGTEVHSLPTLDNMVDNQRRLARKMGLLFWDTREAMGGKDAIVTWRDASMVNADYIHLNHKGGGELGKRFVSAFKTAMGQ